MKSEIYESINNIAQKFMMLSELDKAFIAGYIAAKQETLNLKQKSEDESREIKQ